MGIKKIAVLVSGSGSNLQAIIDATTAKDGILRKRAKVVLVISNNPIAYALERADKAKIEHVVIDRRYYSDDKSYDDDMLKKLQSSEADIICLAGYMRIVGKNIVEAYPEKILNIHPALLPKYGGQGMYGHFVHEAVCAAKDTKSGATVHLVDENYDTGKIVLQKEVELSGTETPQEIAKKVLVVEHQIYPQAIKKIIDEIEEVEK